VTVSTTAVPTPPPTSDVPYALTRLGVVMAPDPAEPYEIEGVLNPATGRTPDGRLLLFPRLVAARNVSRVGRAEVVLEHGVPVTVRRDGVALAPDRGWEHGTGHGGVEDPRITWLPSLGRHVMTYVAFGPLGPRPALAVSTDLDHWTRLGPVQFGYDDASDTDLNLFPNKDVVWFPEVVDDPDGVPSYAVLHRPMWDLSFTRPGENPPLPRCVSDDRPSIWISYVPAAEAEADVTALTRPRKHRQLATPAYDWEALKIGAGPAPIRVEEGWLLLHHGVSGEMVGSVFQPQQHVRYAAGAMILSATDPSRVLARTAEPLLTPETGDERGGTVANVVFPTAIENIDGRWYVFYGMADSKIGVARIDRRIS